MANGSSKELLNSINSMKKSIDNMLRLFTEAAKEEDSTSEKLDEIIEQNKIIAEGMVAISDMVKDFTEKHQEPEHEFPEPTPQPSFQQDFPEPTEFNEELPPLEEPMPPPQMPSQGPRREGPVAMPSIPFSDIGKPKKRGLFGRLKR